MAVLNWKDVKDASLAGEISKKMEESGLSQEEFLAKIWDFYKKYEGRGEFIESMSSLIDKKNKLLAGKLKLVKNAVEIIKLTEEMKIGEEQ